MYDYLELNPQNKCYACEQGIEHDCNQQRKLTKGYYRAGILREFQLFNLEKDWNGDKKAKKLIDVYTANIAVARQKGIGLFIWSKENGRGKTALATWALKTALKSGYTGYFITWSELLNLYAEGWTNSEKKEQASKIIKLSDFLVIDELGKELQKNLSITVLNELLQFRLSDLRPVIITTNYTPKEIMDAYGNSAVSRLQSRCQELFVQGEVDYRGILSANNVSFKPDKREVT